MSPLVVQLATLKCSKDTLTRGFELGVWRTEVGMIEGIEQFTAQFERGSFVNLEFFETTRSGGGDASLRRRLPLSRPAILWPPV
jgi:hypothetical protein